MTQKSDFLAKFQSYSHTELLSIVDNESDYQTTAVEAARELLVMRNLSESDLNIAKAQVADKQTKSFKENEQQEVIKSNVKEATNRVWEAVSAPNLGATDKAIRNLTLIFGILSLLQFIKQYELIGYLFVYDGKWDFTVVLFIVGLLLPPIATYLFWQRKKMGWLLLAFCTTFILATTFASLIKNYNRTATGIPAIDTLYPITSPITYIVTFVFFLLLLLALFRRDLVQAFNIQVRKPIYILAVTTLLILGYFFL